MASAQDSAVSSGMGHRTSFQNPVIWQDLPDMEVIRVGSVYYMSASSFAFSPGAPVLRSSNLVDWEYIGHSVPVLAFGERFNLNGLHPGAYVKGIWASTMRFRPSNGLFYWYGAIQGTEKTFIYTAKNPEDTWTPLPPIDKFYYDLGLLIDNDDAMYIAYGTKTIHVARLSDDGGKEMESRPVYTSDEYLEGARMYNIGGVYYIWLTRPSAGQYVLRSSKGPFGPYECQRVMGAILSPIPGSGFPHQGALVDTPDGKWFYMAFMDGYPAGRIPVLAPVNFNSEGWPEVEADFSQGDGVWRLEYPISSSDEGVQKKPVDSCFKTHHFNHDTLEHCWEWNHNPDNESWKIRDGSLLLTTGTVTDSIFLATNTLTHRTIGPRSMAIFCLDTTGLTDGDRAGACMFRNRSAYIGIHVDADTARLVYVDDLEMGPFSVHTGWINGHPVALDWCVKSRGAIRAEAPLVYGVVWLRIRADLMPAFTHGYEKETRYTVFEYSYDGVSFTQFGSPFAVCNSAEGFVGYRFAVFNFATKGLGGQLEVRDCDIRPWDLEDEAQAEEQGAQS